MLGEAEVIGPIPEGFRMHFCATDGGSSGRGARTPLFQPVEIGLQSAPNGVGILDVHEDDAAIYVAYSGILAFFAQDVAAGTASVATLDRKGAVTCNRRRSRLDFPRGPDG
jgi:hypothetical protein